MNIQEKQIEEREKLKERVEQELSKVGMTVYLCDGESDKEKILKVYSQGYLIMEVELEKIWYEGHWHWIAGKINNRLEKGLKRILWDIET